MGVMKNYIITLWDWNDNILFDNLDVKAALSICEENSHVALVTIENPKESTYASYQRGDFIDEFIEE